MPISVNASFLKNPTATESGVLGVKVLPSLSPSTLPQPTNVAFVIDSSGSMDGSRLDAVKLTLKVVVGMLKPQDKITLVTFSQAANTVLNQYVIAENTEEAKAPALAAIDTINAGGGTNLESGIFMLGNLFKNQPPPGAIVVLTDGHINEGITSFSGLNAIFGTYFDNTPMYTLGYGCDHNADLLKRLAENSHANYTYIKTKEGTETEADPEISLPITMGDLYGGLRSGIATKAVLTYPDSWTCLEPLTEKKGSYSMGSQVANKAMWVMFSVPFTAPDAMAVDEDSAAAVVTPSVPSSTAVTFSVPSVPSVPSVTLTYDETGIGPSSFTAFVDTSLPADELEEPYLRCLNAKVFIDVAALIKNRQINQAIDALKAAIKRLDESAVAMNPGVIRMKADLAETLEKTTTAARAPAHANPGAMNDLVYRTTSVGGNYATQRGRTQMASGATPSLFSSPEQDVTSAQMVGIYSAGGGNPAHHTAAAADPTAVV